MFLRVIGSSPLPNSARRRPDEDKVAKIGEFASASFWILKAPTKNGGNRESGDWDGGERDSMLFGLIVFFITRGGLPPLGRHKADIATMRLPGGRQIPHPENDCAPHQSIGRSAETIIKPAILNRQLAIAQAGQRKQAK